MAYKPTRREMLGAATATLVAATPGMALAQKRQDSAMLPVEAELAKPVTPKTRALLVEALKEVDKVHHDRMKVKLPENSEPCFGYAAPTREVRSR